MGISIHPALELGLRIWGVIFGIWVVLWVISKVQNANQVIENAKNLPGGSNYQADEDEEELGYRAHA